jgi:hypothetical protein
MPLPYIMINTINNFHKLQEGGLKLNNKDLILSKIRLLSGVTICDRRDTALCCSTVLRFLIRFRYIVNR